MPTWNQAFVRGWWAILAVLIGYELYAVFFGNHVDPPLTAVARRHIPWYVLMPFLTWLWMHFARQYTYPKWLLKFIGG